VGSIRNSVVDNLNADGMKIRNTVSLEPLVIPGVPTGSSVIKRVLHFGR